MTGDVLVIDGGATAGRRVGAKAMTEKSTEATMAIDSDWQVIGETRDRLGESPLWHPREQALYWIDFYGPTVHRLEPATGAYRRLEARQGPDDRIAQLHRRRPPAGGT